MNSPMINLLKLGACKQAPRAILRFPTAGSSEADRA